MNEIDLLKGFRDDMPEPTTDAWLRARAAIAAAGADSGGAQRMSIRWRRPVYALTITLVAAASAIVGVFISRTPASTRTITTAAPPAVSPSSTLGASVTDTLQSDANSIIFTQSTTTMSDGEINTEYSWAYPWTGQPGSTVQEASMTWAGGTTLISGTVLSFTVPRHDQLNAGADDECRLAAHGTTIDYADQTWQATVPQCFTLPPGLDVLAPAMRIVGYPMADGQRSVEYQSATRTGTFTLWFSYNNDLPLQSQTTGKGWTETDQYTLLVPTPANLAKLKLTVPAGFNQISARS